MPKVAIMDVMSFVILSLATYRFASLLARENGPFDVFVKLRYILGARYDEHSNLIGTTMLSRLILCVWCSSVWIALVLTVIYAIAPIVAVWLCAPFAISCAAVIIEQKI